MSFFGSRIALIFVLGFVSVVFLFLVQAVQAQDTYTGRPPTYDMHLMPIGEPDPNLEPDYFIPPTCRRAPEPFSGGGWRVPIDPRMSASLPLPSASS